MLTPRENSPLPETHRRVEPATLHHAGQRATHNQLSYSGPLSMFEESSPLLWQEVVSRGCQQSKTALSRLRLDFLPCRLPWNPLAGIKAINILVHRIAVLISLTKMLRSSRNWLVRARSTVAVSVCGRGKQIHCHKTRRDLDLVYDANIDSHSDWVCVEECLVCFLMGTDVMDCFAVTCRKPNPSSMIFFSSIDLDFKSQSASYLQQQLPRSLHCLGCCFVFVSTCIM